MNLNRKVRFVVITGLSGAGKSEAIRCFEDIGFFCVDNIPPSLICDMVDLISKPESTIEDIAVVCDVRGGQYFSELEAALDFLTQKNIDYQILFLEASDDVLIKRYKETRRRHPLGDQGQILESMKKERELLEVLRGRADMVIDTTNLRGHALRDKIKESFLAKSVRSGLLVTIVSFGFKHGIPLDADYVVDVRFLPNPYYDEALKDLTGLDEAVKEYVLSRPETKSFLEKFSDLLEFLMPLYIAEGKTHFVLAIGCTGGNHRSVVLAEVLTGFLRGKGYEVVLKHRELEDTTD